MSQEAYIELNHLAAHNGNPKSNYNLGVVYEYGRGVPVDDEAAFKQYFVVASAGIPEAQHNLGVRYFPGKGTVLNKYEAVKWYMNAAAQSSELSQHSLGLMLMQGDGVSHNLVSALSWFIMTFEHGHGASQPFVDHLTGQLGEAAVQHARELAATFKEKWQAFFRSVRTPINAVREQFNAAFVCS